MSREAPVRTMVVDDHRIVRRGITLALTAFDDIIVVAEAGNCADTLRLCETHRPDVVIMDLLPDDDCPATTRDIRALCPETQVLLLVGLQEAAAVRESIKAGAIGYVLKDACIHELVQAVRDASRGIATPRHWR